MKPLFTYSATVTKVIDGDTIDCLVDLGFNTFLKERFRLYGIDTPEKTSSNIELKALAHEATKFVRDSIDGKQVILETFAKDKYGRWLAKVHLSDTLVTINEQLVTLGLAKPYFGNNKNELDWV